MFFFFLSHCLQKDWKATETNPELLTNAEWDFFFEKMRLYYKPTENEIIQKSEFQKIAVIKSGQGKLGACWCRVPTMHR